MSVKNLLDPILEQGIKNTNFFEGRLLAGEDLRNQHNANRQHDRYLGQAIGQGIINGLEVSLDDGHDGSDGNPPILTVKKGLAINGEGEVIGLPEDDIKLALSRSIEKPKIELADFYACAGAPKHQHVPNGVGVYILVMSPVAGYKERAPKSGLGDEGIAKGCGRKYIQEGIEFRLVEMTTDMLVSMEGVSEKTNKILKNDLLNHNNPVRKNQSDFSKLSKLRSILAHLCFGTEQINNYSIGPFEKKEGSSELVKYGALDELRELNELNDCDVPLALIYWTLDGIAFLDNWSVRRQITGCLNSKSWKSYEVGSRDLMESKAILLQFQKQLEDFLNLLGGSSFITARDYFYFLPPLGILPITMDGALSGYDYKAFFGEALIREPVHIEGAHMFSIVHESFDYPAIDLSSKELIWFYFIRQNMQEVNSGSSYMQTYLIFSNGHMLFRGHARFNLARWNYSNYASIID